MTTHYCYVISANKFVKIGYTRDIPSRMESIQTGCPFQVKLIICFSYLTEAAAREQEKSLHFRFKPFHIHGEWFKKHHVIKHLRKERENNLTHTSFLTDEQMSHIQSIMKE